MNANALDILVLGIIAIAMAIGLAAAIYIYITGEVRHYLPLLFTMVPPMSAVGAFITGVLYPMYISTLWVAFFIIDIFSPKMFPESSEDYVLTERETKQYVLSHHPAFELGKTTFFILGFYFILRIIAQ